MFKGDYSTRVGAGPQAAIPREVLISLGVTKGNYVDFHFVSGSWQISGRHPVSTNYFTPPIEKTLSERLRSVREEKSYVEFSNASDIPAIPADKRAARTKAARSRTA